MIQCNEMGEFKMVIAFRELFSGVACGHDAVVVMGDSHQLTQRATVAVPVEEDVEHELLKIVEVQVRQCDTSLFHFSFT